MASSAAQPLHWPWEEMKSTSIHYPLPDLHNNYLHGKHRRSVETPRDVPEWLEGSFHWRKYRWHQFVKPLSTSDSASLPYSLMTARHCGLALLRPPSHTGTVPNLWQALSQFKQNTILRWITFFQYTPGQAMIKIFSSSTKSIISVIRDQHLSVFSSVKVCKKNETKKKLNPWCSDFTHYRIIVLNLCFFPLLCQLIPQKKSKNIKRSLYPKPDMHLLLSTLVSSYRFKTRLSIKL